MDADPRTNVVVFQLNNDADEIAIGQAPTLADDGIRQAWESAGRERKVRREDVVALHSEWEPSPADTSFIEATFPEAAVTFNFSRPGADGWDEAFAAARTAMLDAAADELASALTASGEHRPSGDGERYSVGARGQGLMGGHGHRPIEDSGRDRASSQEPLPTSDSEHRPVTGREHRPTGDSGHQPTGERRSTGDSEHHPTDGQSTDGSEHPPATAQEHLPTTPSRHQPTDDDTEHQPTGHSGHQPTGDGGHNPANSQEHQPAGGSEHPSATAQEHRPTDDTEHDPTSNQERQSTDGSEHPPTAAQEHQPTSNTKHQQAGSPESQPTGCTEHPPATAQEHLPISHSRHQPAGNLKPQPTGGSEHPPATAQDHRLAGGGGLQPAKDDDPLAGSGEHQSAGDSGESAGGSDESAAGGGELLPVLWSESSPRVGLLGAVPHWPVAAGRLHLALAVVAPTPRGTVGMYHVTYHQLGGQSFDEVMAEACENLAAAGFQVHSRPTDDGPLLSLSGTLVSAVVCLPHFYRRVSELLGTERLVVGLPCPDDVYVAAAGSPVADLVHQTVHESEYPATELVPSVLSIVGDHIEVVSERD